MQCLLLSSKNTHWESLNGMNTGLLPWQQANNNNFCSSCIMFKNQTNTVDPDDTVHYEASDLDLHVHVHRLQIQLLLCMTLQASGANLI